MKRRLILLFLVSIMLLFSSCRNLKYPDFKIESYLHDNSIVFELENERKDMNPNSFTIESELNKEELYNKLKKNQYFIEQYDENTLIFFKSKENNSAYFIIFYRAFKDNIYSYYCKDITYHMADITKSLKFDFPFYVIEGAIFEFLEEIEIKCNFDYIKDFYQRMPYIIEEEGDDFLVIKSYDNYRTISQSKIKIERIGENSIIFHKV